MRRFVPLCYAALLVFAAAVRGDEEGDGGKKKKEALLLFAAAIRRDEKEESDKKKEESVVPVIGTDLGPRNFSRMSQSTVTEKRTVISSSSNVDDALADIGYKPSFGSRASNIMSRSIAQPMRHSTGGSSIVRTVEYGYGSHMGGGLGPGGYSNVSSTGVNSVKSTREQEKKDMRDLNERFANYIEKVRFLEAQNKKLGNELDELRSKWGKETTHIKQMYEAELAEARKLIDDLSRDKAALEIKMSSMQEQFSDLNRQLEEAKNYHQTDRDTINKLNQQLSDYEAEIAMLRRSIESLETERARDKSNINRLQNEVDKLRIDLNNETLAHLDAENRRQTLEEEMEFMKKVHEQELKELAALAYRDTTAENREFWKSELAQAIRDIQAEYDSKVDQLRGDMEGFYNLKIQEYRTGATKQNMEVTHVREENKKLSKQMSDLRGKLADMEARCAQLEKQYQDLLRDFDSKDGDHMMEVTQLREEISKQRAEMEGILTELQTLMDAKLSLELEIAAYRKLLEGEENRVDWRSRASLIMYRDAFRPRQDVGHAVETKEPIVTASRQPEQDNAIQDLNSDTATASSVTTSEPGISPKGEDLEKSQSGDSKIIVGDGELINKSNTDKTGKADSAGQVGMTELKKDVVEEHIASGHPDLKSEVGSPKEEPLVKVKDEVQKIEGKVENGTEMTVSNKVEEDMKEKENAYEEHTQKLEPKLKTGNEKTVSEKTVDVDIINQKVKKEQLTESTDHVDSTTSSLVDEIASSGNESAKSESSAMVDESLPKKDESVIETLSEVKSVEPENINVNQATSKNENQDIDKKEKHAETEQLTTDKDSKDTKLDLRIDKQIFPEKSAPDTKKVEETEVLKNKENIEKRDTQTEDILTAELKIEKTEDKVLETDVQSEATEESFKKEMDTATVELSPTKEKPQGIDSAHKTEDYKQESGNNSQDISHVDVDCTGKGLLDKESTEDRSSAINQSIERPTMDEIPNVQDTKPFPGHIAKEKATDPEKKDISPTLGEKKVQSSLTEEKEDSVLKSSSEKQLTITETVSVANSKSEHETEEQPVPFEDTKITTNAEKGIHDVNDSINLQMTSSKEIIDVDKHHTEDTEETMQLEERHKETGKGAKTVKTDNHDTSDASETVTDKSDKISEGTSKHDSKTHADQVDVNIVQKSESETEVDIKVLGDDDNKSNIHESKTEIKSIETDSSKESESQIKSEKDIKESKDDQNVQVEKNIPKQIESNEEIKKSVVDSVGENKVTEKPIENLQSKQDTDSNQKDSISDTIQKNDEFTEKQLDLESDQIKPSGNADIELKSQKDPEMFKVEGTAGVSQDQTESLQNYQGSFYQERPKTEIVESEVKSSIDPEQTKQDEIVTVSRDQIESSHTKQISSDQVTAKGKDQEKTTQDETMTISRAQIESEHKNETDSPKEKDPEETKQDETMTVSRVQIESEHKNHIDSPKRIDPEELKQDETMTASRKSEHKNHMDADQEVSKKTLANGDIKPVEDESLMKDKQAALPLTNGEIESPTDDTADQLPGTSGGDDSQMSMKMMRGEVSAKTTYQRTSTGPIAISEVDTEGKYITLENTSSGPNRRDVNLDGWRLKRTVDGKKDYIYPFRNFTLKSGKAVKILARKAAGQAGLNDLVFRDEDNWGVGSQVTTALVNDKEEEKATHVQKTLYN